MRRHVFNLPARFAHEMMVVIVRLDQLVIGVGMLEVDSAHQAGMHQGFERAIDRRRIQPAAQSFRDAGNAQRLSGGFEDLQDRQPAGCRFQSPVPEPLPKLRGLVFFHPNPSII